jgi:hypothetical protein
MISRSRGYLPHLVNSQSTYFVTFRLADSLPTSLLLSWQNELQYKRIMDKPKSEEFFYEYDRKIEKYLDNCHGHCWLKNPNIASVVQNALRYFNGERYDLHAWTIMQLVKVTQSVQSFTVGKVIHLNKPIDYGPPLDAFGSLNTLTDLLEAAGS